MNPNQTAEITEVQKIKPAEINKDNSPSSRFEKARGKFLSLSFGIRKVFRDLKGRSGHVALDSEQKDMNILSEQLNNLGTNTESALQKSEIPQHTATDALATPNPEEEKKFFQKDIINFLSMSRSSSPNLDLFLAWYPQYIKYSPEDLAKSVPEYVNFSVNRSHPMESRIALSLKSFNKFLYRGENYSSKGKNILDLIELVDKQGGIGGTAENLTHVSPDPSIALDAAIYGESHPEGFGIWAIDSKVLQDLKEARNLSRNKDYERIIRGVIPLKYVNKLFVTKEMGEKILQRYGGENIKLFGKPIQDVVVGIDPFERPILNTTNPNQISSLIETIYKLNLQRQTHSLLDT